MYKSYSFKDKDPIFDILRTLIQRAAEIENRTFAQMCLRVSEKSGVKPSTLYNWFSGPTISPRYGSVAAVANALQGEISVGARKLYAQPKKGRR